MLLCLLLPCPSPLTTVISPESGYKTKPRVLTGVFGNTALEKGPLQLPVLILLHGGSPSEERRIMFAPRKAGFVERPCSAGFVI